MFVSSLSLPVIFVTAATALVSPECGQRYHNLTTASSISAAQSGNTTRSVVLGALPASSTAFTETAVDYTAGSKCWDEWDAYSHWQTHCPKTTIAKSTYVLSDAFTYTDYKTYKLCDGHPRAVARGGWRTSYSVDSSVQFNSNDAVSVTTFEFVKPPHGIPISTVTTTAVGLETLLDTLCASLTSVPRCTIDSPVCESLFSAWTAGSFVRSRPPCTYAVTGGACDDCAIFVPSVKLLYFPVRMTGDFCGKDYRTATPTFSNNSVTPATAVWSGTTFTSGSAYLSYAGVTAIVQGGGHCGTPLPSGILALPSSDIFSYRGHAAALPIQGDHQWPFNFADLAPNPVPWDAWISQDLCVNHQDMPDCQTITQAAYRPWIVYPREFWRLEPEWSKCGSGAFGIVDPPTALPQAQQEILPTVSKAMEATITKSAAPGQIVNGAGGKQTTSSALLPSPTSGAADPSHSVPKDVASRIASSAGAASSAGPAGLGAHTASVRGGATAQSIGVSSAADPQHTQSPDPASLPSQDTTHPGSPDHVAITTTRFIPLRALQHGDISIGTVAIAVTSGSDAVAVGMKVLSAGDVMTVGSVYVSMGQHELALKVVQQKSESVSKSVNALSVLDVAQATSTSCGSAKSTSGQLKQASGDHNHSSPGTTGYMQSTLPPIVSAGNHTPAAKRPTAHPSIFSGVAATSAAKDSAAVTLLCGRELMMKIAVVGLLYLLLYG